MCRREGDVALNHPADLVGGCEHADKLHVTVLGYGGQDGLLAFKVTVEGGAADAD